MTTIQMRRGLRALSLVMLLGLGACSTSGPGSTERDGPLRPRLGRGGPSATPGWVSVNELSQSLGYRLSHQREDEVELKRGSSTITIDADSRVVYRDAQLIVLDEIPRRRGEELLVPRSSIEKLRPAPVPVVKTTPRRAPVRPRSSRPLRRVPTPKAKPKARGPSLARGSLNGYRVLLDPGHGGKDGGAVRGNVLEKTIALDVSRRVGRHLADAGCEVRYTRSDDRFISLDERVAISGRLQPDVFVSIHANAAVNTSAKGVEIFRAIHRGAGQARDKKARSSALAIAVYGQLAKVSPHGDRGVKPNSRGFRVVKKNRRPAILVELGFISNASERRLLQDPSYRARLALAVARGIAADARSSQRP